MNEWAVNQVVGLVLIFIGVLFDLSGCVGLVRLPDVYNRIQASTKCVVLGTTLILLGALVWLGSTAALVKGLLCILFILVTSSTAAHALSRAAHRSGVRLWSGSVVDRYAEDQGRPAVAKEDGP
ncbi:MAG: Na+/H+ antiporter subunit G [Xanthomonadales bacterium]|nr:monovalent cation/H(+) antiporter subunit G [Gammaproteobacteria bacterium]MBT8050809.1 monovalent cation/H(+) antiporter subunit G [Gammaproteobacteria bacterium]NNJ79550.1 Na+/H+ antiporter subunit G [Xanthomonadales bacterium]NNK37066.1 Na+/H+ antiporter subunit G [Xanthomonadales bacterium]